MKKLWVGIICLLFHFTTVQGQSLDLKLLEHINGPVGPADATWHTVSNSLYFTTVAVPVGMLVSGFALNDHDLKIKALETGGSILIAEASTVILKSITHRTRPYLAHPDLITGKSQETDYSLPSGHASVAFATATSLSLAFPKWYVIAPAYTYAAAVGYSRMYLGVHYPSDVLAGALVGAGSSFLSWKLQKLLSKKKVIHTGE